MKKSLLICVDENFSRIAKLLLFQIYRTTPREFLQNLEITIGYVEGDLSSNSLGELAKLAEYTSLSVSLVPVSEANDLDSSIFNPYSRTTMLRLYFMTYWKKPFVYLDSDILLFQGWHEIFSYINLLSHSPEKTIAAVPDMQIANGVRYAWYEQNLKQFEEERSYFNAGVLAFHPGQWKQKITFRQIKEKLFEILRGGALYFDQDVINILFRNSFLEMERKYNYFATEPFLRQTSKELFEVIPPKILHFAGGIKPWKLEAERKRQIMMGVLGDEPHDSRDLTFAKWFLLEFEFQCFIDFQDRKF